MEIAVHPHSMKNHRYSAVALLTLVAASLSPAVMGQEIIELETTTIQGNTELPKYMYVVPWRDTKSTKAQDRKLKLHNLYGDLFDPLLPAQLPSTPLPVQEPNESE